MVYDAFVDDSKDQHAEKVVVAGIFVGDKDRWGWLRTHWIRRLEQEGMRYFKAAEYYGLRGEFLKFRSEKYQAPTGREAAKRVFDDLEQIICQANLMSIGVVIPIGDYNEVMAMPEAQGKILTKPYNLALFRDLRHHAITELAESSVSDQTIMSIAGHVSARMLAHYSHVRLEAKRNAVECFSQRPEAGHVTIDVTIAAKANN